MNLSVSTASTSHDALVFLWRAAEVDIEPINSDAGTVDVTVVTLRQATANLKVVTALVVEEVVVLRRLLGLGRHGSSIPPNQVRSRSNPRERAVDSACLGTEKG